MNKKHWWLIAGNGASAQKSVSGFSSTERFYTGDNTGPQANLTYFACSIVIKPNINQTTNNWQLMAGKTNSNSNKVGYGFSQFQGACAFFVDGTFQGNAAGEDFFCYATSVGEQDQLQLLTGVVYANKIYLFANGVLTGWGNYRGIDKSSYSSTTRGVCIGAFSQPGAPTNYAPYDSSIYCFQIYENGIGSVASFADVQTQVEAHYQAKLLDIYAKSSGCTHSWDAKDAGASWVDSVGGLAATRTGSIAPITETLSWYPRYKPEDVANETRQYSVVSGTAKVMCLGTSRTIGGHVSYRMGLWQAIQESGDINIDFVGALSFNEIFPDGNYQAYGGTTFDQMLNGGSGHVAIGTAMATYQPDVVIIEGAVNALPDYDSLKQKCLDVCRGVYTGNNNCAVILMDEHVGLRKSSVYDAKVRDFNNWKNRTAIPLLISEGVKMLSSDSVYYDTIDPYTDILVDVFWVHWNQQGMFKMANKIYQPLRLAIGLNRDSQIITNTMKWTFFQNNGEAQASASKTTTSNTEVIMAYALIPANTFSINDVIDLESLFTKPLEVNAPALHYYRNSSISLSGVTTIGSDTFTNGQNHRSFCRRLINKNASNSQVTNNAAQTDYPNDKTSVSSVVKESLSIDWTVTNYIILAGNSPSGTDTLTCEHFSVNAQRMI